LGDKLCLWISLRTSISKKPSFRPSKWPRKLKPAKNSKLPKLPEKFFEPSWKRWVAIDIHLDHPFYYLDKNLSLPKDKVQSIDDLDFDILFKQTLFRSRSESYLNEIVFDEKKFQYLIPTNPPRTTIIPTRTTHQAQNPSRVMAVILSPLALLAQLHDFPRTIIKGSSYMMLREMLLPKRTWIGLIILLT